MTNKEHNGWFNYETWAVNLWMDNEQGSQSYWAGRAQEAYDQSKGTAVFTRAEEATGILADLLKEEHEEALPELTGFAADLLNAAMSEVNWREIAKHLIDNCAKNEVAA